MGSEVLGVWRFVFDISFLDILFSKRVHVHHKDLNLYGFVIRYYFYTSILEIGLDP